MGIAEKLRADERIVGLPLTQKEQWWLWHKENPEVWEMFERFTFEAIEAGHTRLSPWLIINMIRWETTVRTTGEFKIKNDYIAYYSRLFMALHPEHDGFFKTKRMKQDD